MDVEEVRSSRRRIIIEAASKAFSQRGYHEVLVDEVARLAGVGKGTIYRYFKTKEDLYLGTIFHGFDLLNHSLRQELQAEKDSLKKVERIVKALLSFFEKQKHLFQLLHREESIFHLKVRPEWQKKRKETLGLICEVLEDGMREGVFKKCDTVAASHLLLGMLRSLWRHRERNMGLEEMANLVMEIYLRGILKKRG